MCCYYAHVLQHCLHDYIRAAFNTGCISLQLPEKCMSLWQANSILALGQTWELLDCATADLRINADCALHCFVMWANCLYMHAAQLEHDSRVVTAHVMMWQGMELGCYTSWTCRAT